MSRKWAEVKRKLEENAKNASKKRLDENATKKKRLGPSLKRLPRENVLQDFTSWFNNVTPLAENVENPVAGKKLLSVTLSIPENLDLSDGCELTDVNRNLDSTVSRQSLT